jgi:ubiquinone/menaquinone biosynthesis C-methylase UbiE
MPSIASGIASEQRPLEIALQMLPASAAHAKRVVDRINAVRPLPPDAAILDIGAAQGVITLAFAEMGYRPVGLEPWSEARAIARTISAMRGSDIPMVEGVAESLPLDSDTFDLVHAMSVIEHVNDVEATFREAYRVLKKGGVFWFQAASAM